MIVGRRGGNGITLQGWKMNHTVTTAFRDGTNFPAPLYEHTGNCD